MKKITLIIVIALVVAGGIIGVVIGSDSQPAEKSTQMDEYIEMVKQLQTGDQATRAEIMEQLSEDSLWTLLDEIGDPEVDEQQQYMTLDLNAMAYEAAMSRIGDFGKPQGVFVDGQDPNYPICFIEKTLAAGSEVTYTLGRSGNEDVAVVEMAEGDLDVWMNGGRIEASDMVFRGQMRGNVTIRLRNRRGYAVNFVIINRH